MTYITNLVAISPEPHMADANHLAAAVGLCEADLSTFSVARYSHDNGLYAAANAAVKQTVLDLLPLAGTGYELPRPEWDTEAVIDMSKAQSVFDDLVIWIPEYGEDGELINPPELPTDRLFVTVGVDPHWVFEQVGLSLFESET